MSITSKQYALAIENTYSVQLVKGFLFTKAEAELARDKWNSNPLCKKFVVVVNLKTAI